MQRRVLRADCAGGAKPAANVTLVLPETLGEYRQALAEVRTSPRPDVETRPAERPGLMARLAGHVGRRTAVGTEAGDRVDDAGVAPAGKTGPRRSKSAAAATW